MKSQDQIDVKVKEIGAELDKDMSLNRRSSIDAILEVLEEDLDDDAIYEAFYDENKTEREQSAIRARQWLDDEITDEEFYY